LRKSYNQLRKVFDQGFTVKQLTLDSRLSIYVMYKRFSKTLSKVTSKKRIIRIRGQKLILLIDAQWQYFDHKLWTLYFVSIKSVGSEFVTVLDPVLNEGKERMINWKQIIDNFPQGIKKRIIAVVSDGIRGIETVADDNGWVIQRCHFHLLSLLQKMRGKRASTPGRLLREDIYSSIKLALSEKSGSELDMICRRIANLANNPICPKRMKMAARDFLRRIHEFRSYIDHPDLKLPTTVNVMESINSFTRRKSKTINNPQSWHKWAVACIRFKSKFNCK
jgi:hypothetical protein